MYRVFRYLRPPPSTVWALVHMKTVCFQDPISIPDHHASFQNYSVTDLLPVLWFMCQSRAHFHEHFQTFGISATNWVRYNVVVCTLMFHVPSILTTLTLDSTNRIHASFRAINWNFRSMYTGWPKMNWARVYPVTTDAHNKRAWKTDPDLKSS